MAEKSTDQAKKARGATSISESSRGPNNLVLILGVVALAALAASALYYFGDRLGLSGKDGQVSGVLAPGPLPDMALGSASAPYTIVEYASMTCPHCANFQSDSFPKVKSEYIDTGKARYIFREFPIDGLALAASMVARCVGAERFFPMVDALFETQKTWAVPGAEGKEKLLQVARQAGMSKQEFDKCLEDKQLFENLVEIRRRAHEEYGVDGTPAFFVNGKKIAGAHSFEDLQEALGDKPSGDEKTGDQTEKTGDGHGH